MEEREHKPHRIEVHHYLHFPEHPGLGELLNRMASNILIIKEQTMATLQEVQKAAQDQADANGVVAQEMTTVGTNLGNVGTELTALAQKISDLIANPPAGGINPTDLDPIVAQMNDSTSKIKDAGVALQASADALQASADAAGKVLGA